MTCDDDALYIDTDHVVHLNGLKNQDGDPVTAATVEMTLYHTGTEATVDGVSWPVELDHTGDGDYEGELPDTVEVEPNRKYDAVITATQSDVTGTWRKTLPAKWRTF